ncbi:hypothetical protein XELAEV_18032365mg [Xenopus laevis]|uniref:Uncharacterized protein n=1 Tax=Xenopus laevis TaxID=8355 RepID=A0A974CPE6_XENLA|nr:hypothetical protein XELAEV_18032365mg [Xenopus laevis]
MYSWGKCRSLHSKIWALFCTLPSDWQPVFRSTTPSRPASEAPGICDNRSSALMSICCCNSRYHTHSPYL